MNIETKFLCPEIVGEMKNGLYEVPEGATVRDLFKECESRNNINVNTEYYKWLQFLADGKPASWDTALDGVKTVHILRIALGG